MFERFTERARQVVVLAQDEARLLKHNYIGTEHELLGLIREEDGLAARVLESVGLTIDDVRADVTRIVGRGEGTPSGQIPFTPRAKKVLELSMREALALGHQHIGTEHILLGLVREGEGVAVRILLDHGVGPDTMRDLVIRMLSGTGGGQWLEYKEAKEDEPLELTSPPISPEVIEEIARVGEAKERAIEAQEFERAARLRNRERRLQLMARDLQRVWEEE
jgi:ATP-dependent Clp protease ATP-binding subunit ClpC